MQVDEEPSPKKAKLSKEEKKEKKEKVCIYLYFASLVLTRGAEGEEKGEEEQGNIGCRSSSIAVSHCMFCIARHDMLCLHISKVRFRECL